MSQKPVFKVVPDGNEYKVVEDNGKQQNLAMVHWYASQEEAQACADRLALGEYVYTVWYWLMGRACKCVSAINVLVRYSRPLGILWQLYECLSKEPDEKKALMFLHCMEEYNGETEQKIVKKVVSRLEVKDEKPTS